MTIEEKNHKEGEARLLLKLGRAERKLEEAQRLKKHASKCWLYAVQNDFELGDEQLAEAFRNDIVKADEQIAEAESIISKTESELNQTHTYESYS